MRLLLANGGLINKIVLLLLDLFASYGLRADEDPFPIVWLGLTPATYLRSKASDVLPIRTHQLEFGG